MPYSQKALYSDIAQVQHSRLNLFGSGRLIGPNLVLTARHVLTPKGVKVPEQMGWQVRLMADRPDPPQANKWKWMEASVAWTGQETLDLALLKLVPRPGVPDQSPTLKLRIARIENVNRHQVRALGFPRGAKVDDKRELFVSSGELGDESGNTLSLGIDQADQPESPDEDWRGFSGAAILLAESVDPEVVWIYGVAQQVPPHFKRRLGVARLAKAWEDDGFRTTLEAAGIALDMPVDPIVHQETVQGPPDAALPSQVENRKAFVTKRMENRGDQMFPGLPFAQFNEEILVALGAAMTEEVIEAIPEDQHDGQENSGISAGYTYLGQFIYNDLTFGPGSTQNHADPASSNAKSNPRFDLDCVYGSGPLNQPFLYDADGRHMLLGSRLTGSRDDPNARTVPRNQLSGYGSTRAVIGDPRNDENVILSQLHSALLRFHNRVVDLLGVEFEEAQRLVRFHYQWVVLFDFLPTIIGFETLKSILPHLDKGTNVVQDPPQLKFYKPEGEAYIPIEFSVAAYRFGHSMIRPNYRLNRKVRPMAIISPGGEDLRGFRTIPKNWGIDWDLFFPMSTEAPNLGADRLQPSYKIDTSLVNMLGILPVSIASAQPSLAARNLLRGFQMKLPSGQAVAEAMGIRPLPDDRLTIGPATEIDKPTNVPITQVSSHFKGNAPLWYYILAEAQQQFSDDTTPIRLGPVGGRIVGEVFIGLMIADAYSFLRQNPLFQPDPALCSLGNFKMADLLRQSMA